jgi:hypothetical protein
LASDQMQALLSFCRIKSTTLVIAIAISSCYNWDQPGMELQNSPK